MALPLAVNGTTIESVRRGGKMAAWCLYSARPCRWWCAHRFLSVISPCRRARVSTTSISVIVCAGGISPATQGAGETAVTHLIIKPSDIGLTTNMVITTNRRAYTIKLVSRRTDWMPRVSFDYPDAVSAEWGVYRQRQRDAREAQEAAVARDMSHPDFGYRISGDNPSWQPVRVYAASGKTYIQFPRDIAHGDLPALVALADDGGLFTEPTKELVNYRYTRGAFVVDKVLERAALISGVGSDQIIVRIEHQGRR